MGEGIGGRLAYGHEPGLVTQIEACLESMVDIGTPVGTEAGTGKTVEKFWPAFELGNNLRLHRIKMCRL